MEGESRLLENKDIKFYGQNLKKRNLYSIFGIKLKRKAYYIEIYIWN